MNILVFDTGPVTIEVASFVADDGRLQPAHRASFGIGRDGSVPLDHLSSWLRTKANEVDIIGHGLVDGGALFRPTRVTTDVARALMNVRVLDPSAPPTDLELLRFTLERWVTVPHVVCFDTGFYAGLPSAVSGRRISSLRTARRRPRGVLHGLNCEHVVSYLGADRLRRAVIAHLAFPSSATAVLHGIAIDATTGFGPDVGPEPASDAFADSVARAVSVLKTSLGGLDTLVFTGEIGETSSEIRGRIAAKLSFLPDFACLVVPAHPERTIAAHCVGFVRERQARFV